MNKLFELYIDDGGNMGSKIVFLEFFIGFTIKSIVFEGNWFEHSTARAIFIRNDLFCFKEMGAHNSMRTVEPIALYLGPRPAHNHVTRYAVKRWHILIIRN